MGASDPDDDLYLGSLIVNVEDGELALVAYWGEVRRQAVVMVAHVVDCRECEN